MPPTEPTRARIEVFRPGTFRPMGGEPITYSAADLRAIADAYDAEGAPAPVVVGHPEVDAPAFGWVKRFDFDAGAGRLFAELDEIEPQFAEMVKAGRFRKVSMAFFSPRASHNPVPGTWYPKHVGFLGAAAPAVSGLKPARFAGEADVMFEAAFGDRGLEETASILRTLRDFFIEKFGLEETEKALPSWRIEWLGQMEPEAKPAAFAGAAPAQPQQQPTEEDPAVTKPDPAPDPAFAAREAEIAAREGRIAAREAALVHADNLAFAERLVTEGRLLPASKDKAVSLLDALPGEATVAFADGAEKVSPAQALREILEAQPKVVNFGRLDMPEGGEGARAATFAADGKPVDPAGLEKHTKALDYQRQHPGTAYIDAVRAVS
jgi:hypothetical protein